MLGGVRACTPRAKRGGLNVRGILTGLLIEGCEVSLVLTGDDIDDTLPAGLQLVAEEAAKARGKEAGPGDWKASVRGLAEGMARAAIAQNAVKIADYVPSNPGWTEGARGHNGMSWRSVLVDALESCDSLPVEGEPDAPELFLKATWMAARKDKNGDAIPCAFAVALNARGCYTAQLIGSVFLALDPRASVQLEYPGHALGVPAKKLTLKRAFNFLAGPNVGTAPTTKPLFEVLFHYANVGSNVEESDAEMAKGRAGKAGPAGGEKKKEEEKKDDDEAKRRAQAEHAGSLLRRFALDPMNQRSAKRFRPDGPGAAEPSAN